VGDATHRGISGGERRCGLRGSPAALHACAHHGAHSPQEARGRV
jgi:hypothetical protein